MITVSDDDVSRALRAIANYRSQFEPEQMKSMQEAFKGILGTVSFRRALPPSRSDGLETSLFPDGLSG